nr:MAG TPA: hypothetical protein [Caudoviricetes sp.]DAQ08692.1 MAG TPA: hypothetical protein [Caudoviricetes sp.]
MSDKNPSFTHYKSDVYLTAFSAILCSEMIVISL